MRWTLLDDHRVCITELTTKLTTNSADFGGQRRTIVETMIQKVHVTGRMRVNSGHPDLDYGSEGWALESLRAPVGYALAQRATEVGAQLARFYLR